MKHVNIPIFVPHKGCPHDCVFCNQKKITGQSADVTADDVKNTIEEHLSTIDINDAYVEVAFFGGSFTAIELDKQTELLEAVYPFVKSGKVNAVRCSTRPDAIDESILLNLQKYGVKTIELGVQSTDDEVLLKSGRGHKKDVVFSSSNLIKDYGFDLGLQMMLGLPGDTPEKSLKTAKDIKSLSPKCVRIYPTLVVDDTHLLEMYNNGEYKPFDLETTVHLCAKLLKMFYKEGIDVIRVGLQTTDNINEKTVIGPYHPSLKELCESYIIRDLIEDNIKNITDDVIVLINPKNISKAVGNKKSNISYFKDNFKINLRVMSDENIHTNQIVIKSKNFECDLPILS